MFFVVLLSTSSPPSRLDLAAVSSPVSGISVRTRGERVGVIRFEFRLGDLSAVAGRADNRDVAVALSHDSLTAGVRDRGC